MALKLQKVKASAYWLQFNLSMTWMSLYTYFHDIQWLFSYFTENLNSELQGGARGNDSDSAKLVGFTIWRSRKHFLRILPISLETFQCGMNWWTDIATPRAAQLAGLKTQLICFLRTGACGLIWLIVLSAENVFWYIIDHIILPLTFTLALSAFAVLFFIWNLSGLIHIFFSHHLWDMVWNS